jgi:V/A-type H+-transporting ATPase subunit E
LEGLEAIKLRILADAREEADAILRQARETAAELKEKNEQTAAQLLTEARQTGNARAEAVVSRARSLAALDQRKTLLGARQELVDETIRLALERLAALEPERKLVLYQALIEQSGMAEGVEVILSRQDQMLGPRLLLQSRCQISVSEQAGNFAGGLVIRSGLIEENLTFETLIKNDRPALVRLAADILFAAEEPAP